MSRKEITRSGGSQQKEHRSIFSARATPCAFPTRNHTGTIGLLAADLDTNELVLKRMSSPPLSCGAIALATDQLSLWVWGLYKDCCRKAKERLHEPSFPEERVRC